MEIDLDKILDESRQLRIGIENPDGTSEYYVYYLDSPGLCVKLLENSADEVVDFDFIPEYVTAAVMEILEKS